MVNQQSNTGNAEIHINVFLLGCDLKNFLSQLTLNEMLDMFITLYLLTRSALFAWRGHRIRRYGARWSVGVMECHLHTCEGQ